MRGQKAAGPSFFTVDFYSSAPVIINQTHETSPLVKKKIENESNKIDLVIMYIGRFSQDI